MSDQGTHIFITDLKNISLKKGEEALDELVSIES
jgi:hypothetical protein